MAITNLANVVVGLADSLLSRELDPEPIRFRAADRKDSGIVTAALRNLPDNWHKVKRQVTLGKFLYGCRAFERQLPVEYLVVGLGHRKRNGFLISRLIYVVGNEGSVPVPHSLTDAIHAHVLSSHDAEAAVFHNHPPTLTHAVLNHGPIASRADRRVWLNSFKDLRLLAKRVLGGGRVRFYLGENATVREFDAPSILDVVELLPRIGNA